MYRPKYDRTILLDASFVAFFRCSGGRDLNAFRSAPRAVLSKRIQKTSKISPQSSCCFACLLSLRWRMRSRHVSTLSGPPVTANTSVEAVYARTFPCHSYPWPANSTPIPPTPSSCSHCCAIYAFTAGIASYHSFINATDHRRAHYIRQGPLTHNLN